MESASSMQTMGELLSQEGFWVSIHRNATRWNCLQPVRGNTFFPVTCDCQEVANSSVGQGDWGLRNIRPLWHHKALRFGNSCLNPSIQGDWVFCSQLLHVRMLASLFKTSVMFHLRIHQCNSVHKTDNKKQYKRSSRGFIICLWVMPPLYIHRHTGSAKHIAMLFQPLNVELLYYFFILTGYSTLRGYLVNYYLL